VRRRVIGASRPDSLPIRWSHPWGPGRRLARWSAGRFRGSQCTGWLQFWHILATSRVSPAFLGVVRILSGPLLFKGFCEKTTAISEPLSFKCPSFVPCLLSVGCHDDAHTIGSLVYQPARGFPPRRSRSYSWPGIRHCRVAGSLSASILPSAHQRTCTVCWVTPINSAISRVE